MNVVTKLINVFHYFKKIVVWLTRYNPFVSEDDDLNVWMFAMIGIGCVFIVFVAASIFLLWSVYSSAHPCKENADECHLLGINDGKNNLNDDDDS